MRLLGLRIKDFGLRVSDLGFRVYGAFSLLRVASSKQTQELRFPMR